MKTNVLGQRIKSLRNRKGYSQEELAEKTSLSLRTIQRIENGQTDPRGDSLKRLSAALGVSPDEIVDWTVQENRGLLALLNLSALSFLVFPLLGVIALFSGTSKSATLGFVVFPLLSVFIPLGTLVPLVIWVSKKDKVRGINEVARSLLNFQITWLMVWFAGIMLCLVSSARIGAGEIAILLFLPLCYNIIFIILNTVRVLNRKEVKYFPRIPFIRN